MNNKTIFVLLLSLAVLVLAEKNYTDTVKKLQQLIQTDAYKHKSF